MKSFISNQEIKKGEAVKTSDIREGIFHLIKLEYPAITFENYISLDELNTYRRQYLSSLISQENGELAQINQEVIDAIKNNSTLSDSFVIEADDELTLGQKIADKIALFGGSWAFIISFFGFMMAWIFVNAVLLASKPLDPYPFILLNLVLSCLAAIQAPIIMMSQNRQEQKDRLRSEQDYKINLKAEFEIKLLSEKIDHLLVQQSKKLMEIQEVQIDYLEDLMKAIKQP